MRAACGVIDNSNQLPLRAQACPLVSVVVPAYNAQHTLARTIRSVLAQSYTNLEVIVVDDGSTDATREIAEEFARTDPRLHVLTKPNEGVARARNFGMEAARSELIAPVDAVLHGLGHERTPRTSRTAIPSAAIAAFTSPTVS